MKNKLLFLTLTALLTTAVIGCNEKAPADTSSIPYEEFELKQAEENFIEQENTTEQESAVTESKVTESTDLTFADLSELQFGFSSGAGAWSEEFTIEKDGYLTGKFRDSDMGAIGEGYNNGTVYCCSYTGHFTNLTKINDYTYQMKLADITYKETAGTEEIKDNTYYIYTDSYCLGGTDTFTIYLPKTPISELSEDVLSWLSVYENNGTELGMIAIVDKINEYGIYSYDRPEPLEDAQTVLDKYKESVEYYSNKLSEASTTLEMVECSGAMYEVSDDCLNYIWNLIRYNTEEAQFNKILAEQREWITEKETKGKEANSEYEGGSLAPVDYNVTMADFTMERCEELIEYLK